MFCKNPSHRPAIFLVPMLQRAHQLVAVLSTWLKLETHWSMNDMMTHQMETFSASLAFCAGNSSVTGEFPTQRPVTRAQHFVSVCFRDKLLHIAQMMNAGRTQFIIHYLHWSTSKDTKHMNFDAPCERAVSFQHLLLCATAYCIYVIMHIQWITLYTYLRVQLT